MGGSGFRHLGDRVVHQGNIWRVAVGSFEAPDGEVFHRDIVRSPGAVGIVAVGGGALDEGERSGEPVVALVRQYRPAFDAAIWEIPAGMRDVPGEPPEVTAARELAEEVGLAATDIDLLARFYPSAGMTDSVVHVYLATGLSEVGRAAHGPEESHMEVARVPLADALAMVERGEIVDAKSVIGLLLAERRLRGA